MPPLIEPNLRARLNSPFFQDMSFGRAFFNKLIVMRWIQPVLQAILPAGVYSAFTTRFYNTNTNQYYPYPNPMTMDTVNYPTTINRATRPHFIPFSGAVSGGKLSDGDIATVVDLQMRIWVLEQMLMGNTSSSPIGAVSDIHTIQK